MVRGPGTGGAGGRPPARRPRACSCAARCASCSAKDFLAPLVYLQDADKYTIEIGLTQFYNAYSGQPRWDLLTAVSLVTMIPMVIIFFFASKYIVRGVTLSGMGGT